MTLSILFVSDVVVCHKLLDLYRRYLYATNYWICILRSFMPLIIGFVSDVVVATNYMIVSYVVVCL